MAVVVEFACSHCGGRIRTSAEYAGKQGACPHCGKQVLIQAPTGDLRPAAEVKNRNTGVASSTDINTLLAGGVAGVATILSYLGLLAIRESYVGQLFTNRGFIPFITTLVTFWGFAILVLKWAAVRHQLSYAESELDLMPLEEGVQINSKNVDTFVQHIDGLPPKARRSIIGRRIHGGLEHFRWRNSVPEVQAYLSSQAEIDASAVDAGYTFVRAFIWAIPILGFIGTVLGISEAVTGLNASLKSAIPGQVATADTDAPDDAAPSSARNIPPGTNGDAPSMGTQMINAMGLVTKGLATAFDTTFIALGFAICLMFPTEWLKKTEYRMLDRIEAFTNDSLLRRMSNDKQDETLTPEVAHMLEPAFRRHQQWLVEWQNNVAELGSVIGKDFETHANHIQQKMAMLENHKSSEAVELVRSCTQAVESMGSAMGQLGMASDTLQSTLRAATELQELLAMNTQTLKSLVDGAKLTSTLGDTSAQDRFAAVMGDLTDCLADLKTAVERNGSADMSVPKKRGWFGRG